MNLRSIDLNLLVVLDALLDEAHVSRAAHRLNLSQPAVSNALQRCRDLFDDPLLERGRGAMRRTARAEALRGPLKSILSELIDLVDPPETPLNRLRQTVRLTMADDPTFLIAGPLLTALQSSAPGLTPIFQPWNGSAAAERDLLNGETDIAVSVFTNQIEGIEQITLFDETYVVAMRRDHPAAQAFDLDAWLAFPHVLMSGTGDAQSPLDVQLAAIGRSRRVGAVVPSFQLVPSLLAHTDYIAMLPKHGFDQKAHPLLSSFDPPIEVRGFPLHLASHTRQSNNRGVQHVIATIREIFLV
ncbi:LysR substrate-binding domain-containing protein [Celeribacter sp.]|uniref:LysR family transcriptional regulator n=1 Tax=Celeribacter sp. TaxID=1890673 RepID=UPI003A930272